MAALGGEPQPFPGAALALPAPLNRGLERALEEAAHSGGLNLSGRKMKEFPRSAAALSHDLSDTVRAENKDELVTAGCIELLNILLLRRKRQNADSAFLSFWLKATISQICQKLQLSHSLIHGPALFLSVVFYMLAEVHVFTEAHQIEVFHPSLSAVIRASCIVSLSYADLDCNRSSLCSVLQHVLQLHDEEVAGPDLSKNRLTEVPTELCHFVSLETLNLYHNCIKIIPDAIVNLQMLTYLNLSRNQLSSLPSCLCGLPLKVLIASNNKLGSLPEEIGQLKQLMELDVSCNEITALPQQIGQLKSLKELNVRRNYLEVLPQELVQLPLVKFDFSCNKVLVIPICFRKMVQLQVLLLENNPLQSPPAQICTKGKVHIFKYLAVQACQIKTADSLYLNAIEQQHLPQPVEESIDDIYPSKKDSDSGVGSDNGDKRLSATEPSDEDTISFNVPMSDIMEEDHVVKEDSSHHANSRKVDFHQGSSHLIVNDKSRETGNEFDESDTLTTEFMSYIKSRAAECDELLRIEEDAQWQTDEIMNLSEEQALDIAMIEQLREAVDLLQDPNSGQMQMEMSSLGQRENTEKELEFQRRRELIMEKTKSEVRTCEQGEKWSLSQNDIIVWNTSGQTSYNENKGKSPTMSPTTNATIPFGLKPRSADPSLSLPPISFNTLTQAQTWDNFSYSIPSEGDSDNVFLRPQRNLESIDPQFTIRRKMEQMREERELVEQLRENIETRLKICLPEDLGSALMDGVVLCHLVNHVRPRSVGSIHVPSPAVPKLSMAKCRRNVENFLDACRKLGIPEEKLCLPHHILEEKGLVKVSVTVQALLDVTTLKQALFT